MPAKSENRYGRRTSVGPQERLKEIPYEAVEPCGHIMLPKSRAIRHRVGWTRMELGEEKATKARKAYGTHSGLTRADSVAYASRI